MDSRPQLATPISHLFEDAGARRDIVAASDCLEVRDKSFESDLPRQFLFHSDLDIVKPWSGEDKEYIGSIVRAKKELLLLSFHMVSCFTKPDLRSHVYHPGGVIVTRNELLQGARRNIDWLRKCPGANQIEIAVENNNYYPTGAYEHVTESDFIAEVVRENSVRLLFDLAHARITAHNRHLPYERYVAGLPLDRMIQIHVSQHGVNDDGLAFDAHDLPDAAVLAETRKLAEDHAVEFVTFEYYGDADGLVKLLRRFKDRLQMAVG